MKQTKKSKLQEKAFNKFNRLSLGLLGFALLSLSACLFVTVLPFLVRLLQMQLGSINLSSNSLSYFFMIALQLFILLFAVLLGFLFLSASGLFLILGRLMRGWRYYLLITGFSITISAIITAAADQVRTVCYDSSSLSLCQNSIAIAIAAPFLSVVLTFGFCFGLFLLYCRDNRRK